MKVSDKPLPVLYDKEENCCGCSACYAICPVDAIIMSSNKNGIIYPKIDEKKCLRCYRCMKICIFK